jgi:GrpB-like predicted nucleotidyltransferase (UPF0157 family)
MSNTDIIILEQPNPDWPDKFEKEARKLKELLGGENIARIEHIGSTAIPGLSAKPIIDIAIGVLSLRNATRFIPKLQKAGYTYWDKNPKTDRMFFVKGLPPNGPRSFHVHIMEIKGDEFPKRIFFRDYLRDHPEEVKKYDALKKKLADKYKEDREAYTEAKTEYISRILGVMKQGSL